MKIKRALISVSDKTGIVDFAKALFVRGIEILSTGGTARLLRDHGIEVIEVADYTGFPEMMGGRLKTLHPKIFGGILGRRGIDDDVMTRHGILPIDVVAVNLYPFEAMAEKGGELPELIEHIDIGGPALIRAAAKNFQGVTVAVDPSDYPTIAEAIRKAGEVDEALRFHLAVKAFAHTARYDGIIANRLGERETASPFPPALTLQFQRLETLRYGENPHQPAAFYKEIPPPPATLASAKVLQGKALSYNNIADADAALSCIKALPSPACVIVKHANPCGVALGKEIREAYERAYQADPTSAFGGIIAFNLPLDAETAEAILERQFVEVILAPSIDRQALPVLARKPNVRVLETGPWEGERVPGFDLKRVAGGLLVQGWDLEDMAAFKTVTRRAPTEQEIEDLRFAWKVVEFVKSNAIVYAREGQTVGIGAGQPSRVMSARIAALKAEEAGLEVQGAVMASDAFFPFRDSIDQAAQAGITAVIQPGGSVRDKEVIAAADEHGMAMVFTGTRHFRH